jgi:RNA polymerase sigma-70 factor (ECF subfamily)
MMFSCCDPRLPDEVRVALVLNILCGFGAAEIAAAFLTSRAAMEKRLARGKRVLARSRRVFDLADREFAPRLSSVHHALYLLFNEGYHGSSPEAAVQADLCREAIRLTTLLLEAKGADQPETFALAALMCLQAARLPARVNADGHLSPLSAQDRSRWDAELVRQGLDYLDRSACGPDLTAYHIEAAIASAHVTAPSVAETNWTAIVGLYDRLMSVAPSPVVALSRAIAIGERDGPAAGLDALAAIADHERLKAYPFYPAAMGELELRLGRTDVARDLFTRAASLARNLSERQFFAGRLEVVTGRPNCDY